MTRDEVIALAREAEQYANTFCESIGDTEHNHWFDAYNERFAALVAKAERDRICEMLRQRHKQEERHNYYGFIANIIEESA